MGQFLQLSHDPRQGPRTEVKNINRGAAEFVGGDAQIVGDARRRLAHHPVREGDAMFDWVAEHGRHRHLLKRLRSEAGVLIRQSVAVARGSLKQSQHLFLSLCRFFVFTLCWLNLIIFRYICKEIFNIVSIDYIYQNFAAFFDFPASAARAFRVWDAGRRWRFGAQ